MFILLADTVMYIPQRRRDTDSQIHKSTKNNQRRRETKTQTYTHRRRHRHTDTDTDRDTDTDADTDVVLDAQDHLRSSPEQLAFCTDPQKHNSTRKLKQHEHKLKHAAKRDP